ncbi:hypothetical protein M3J09_011946 [Ascochyta lentis]
MYRLAIEQRGLNQVFPRSTVWSVLAGTFHL